MKCCADAESLMKKVRYILWAAVAVLAGIIGWLTLEMSAKRNEMVEGPFGVPFELTDYNGETITEQAFREKPSMLFFGFTFCPDVCPTTLFEMDGWLKEIDPDGTKLNAFLVTVDPERDTPQILKTYVTSVNERVMGITGEPAKVNEMVKGFRVYSKKVPLDEKDPNGDYTMDHSASIFLLDSKGRFAGTIAYEEDRDVALTKLKNLMAR
jgi:protein SCO1/2